MTRDIPTVAYMGYNIAYEVAGTHRLSRNSDHRKK
jgi:hypothetical protein